MTSGTRGEATLRKKRDVFADRYARVRNRLSPSFKRVAAFIDDHRLDVLTLSALDLAREIGTSDATVVRTVQALGFDGLADLRHELARFYQGAYGPQAWPDRCWTRRAQ
jgi:DNA-binding MurR/RpiR family transcriptional regulator